MNLRFKKGQIQTEVLIIAIIVFVLAIMGIGLFMALDETNDAFQADSDLSNLSKQTLQKNVNDFPNMMDNIVAIVFVLLWIGTLIAAFLIDTHPIFFVFSIIIFISVLIIGAILSNVYAEYIASDGISGLENNFPMTNFLMNNLLIAVLVVGFSILMVLYGKNRFAG